MAQIVVTNYEFSVEEQSCSPVMTTKSKDLLGRAGCSYALGHNRIKWLFAHKARTISPSS